TVRILFKRPQGALGRILAISNWNGPVLIATTDTDLIQFKWADLCTHMNFPGSCETVPYGSHLEVTFAIDENNTGVYASGDPKVTVDFVVVNPGHNENVYGEPLAEGIENFRVFPGDQSL